MTKALDIQVERNQSGSQPEHHVLPASCGWASYLPGWPLAPAKRRSTFKKDSKAVGNDIASFRNPWPSFHKATKQELLQSLEWGEDSDPAINLAASHLPSGSSNTTRPQQAAQLLHTQQPDFTFDTGSGQRAKTTWLGHAGVLLQLAPLKPGSSPIRIVFDPIFSQRSSPSQYVGPIRSYAPPCKLEDLPPIDLLLISHNHFDHLDYNTVIALWRLNREQLRVIVPLKNAKWFIGAGIPAERVIELDWWESATLTEEGFAAGQLKVSCTPAQHSSVRDGQDENATLWAGWFLTHSPKLPNNNSSTSYRVFFAGDSGYQCHADPAWPPRPPQATTHQKLMDARVDKVADPDHIMPEKYPPCPAYKEIATRLGTPDLVYLPVALGATWAYIRSFFSNYVPPSAVPVPRHSAGITGGIHMPPWDAVRVFRELRVGGGDNAPVAVAIHWGTFVTEPIEILKTLGHLEWACYNQGVKFARTLEEASSDNEREPVFVALNHGQSIDT